jgi:hypothetical protein
VYNRGAAKHLYDPAPVLRVRRHVFQAASCCVRASRLA